MGLFSTPKCPHCGGKLTYQGGSIGIKPWRCNTCIKRNREKREEYERMEARFREQEKRIDEITRKIEENEKYHEGS